MKIPAKDKQTQGISFKDIRRFFLPGLVVIFFIGMMMVLVAGGIHYAIFRSIPRFLGFSRLWLDLASFTPYMLVVFVYSGVVIVEQDDMLSGRDDYKISFLEFIFRRPWISLFGLFLSVFFALSVLHTFALGMIAVTILGILSGAWCVVRRIWQFSLSIILWFMLRKARVKLA